VVSDTGTVVDVVDDVEVVGELCAVVEVTDVVGVEPEPAALVAGMGAVVEVTPVAAAVTGPRPEGLWPLGDGPTRARAPTTAPTTTTSRPPPASTRPPRLPTGAIVRIGG